MRIIKSSVRSRKKGSRAWFNLLKCKGMAELSSDHIEHLSRLSRIELNLEERERFAGQLSSIVQYVEQLSQVDTSKVGPLRGVTGLQNVLAADAPREAGSQTDVPRASLLKGAPGTSGEYIEVRAVLGDEVVSA